MTKSKRVFLNLLKEEFDRWEQLLATMSEDQIVERRLPSDLSIKDVVAHLWTWQKRSIERLVAALQDREPDFSSEWPANLDPETESDIEPVNAWIHKTNLYIPWTTVYHNWKEGYLYFVQLAEKIPEEDLLAPGKYAWMEGEPLSLVLQGSYEHHHQEHLEPLLAWLHQHGGVNTPG